MVKCVRLVMTRWVYRVMLAIIVHVIRAEITFGMALIAVNSKFRRKLLEK